MFHVFVLFFQDIEDLALECSDGDETLQESVASKRLGRKVESIIDVLDSTLSNLEKDFVYSKTNLDMLNSQKQTLVAAHVNSLML